MVTEKRQYRKVQSIGFIVGVLEAGLEIKSEIEALYNVTVAEDVGILSVTRERKSRYTKSGLHQWS